MKGKLTIMSGILSSAVRVGWVCFRPGVGCGNLVMAVFVWSAVVWVLTVL